MHGFQRQMFKAQRVWVHWLLPCAVYGFSAAMAFAQSLEPSLIWVPPARPLTVLPYKAGEPVIPGGFGMAFGAPFSGEKISLNFQQIELRALLQVIADFTHINIVASDAVAGTATVRLMDVPWDQALDIVLQSKGMSSRRKGNVVWVAPQEEWLQREKQALDNQATLQASAPLQTVSISLQYAKAGDLAQRLGVGAGLGTAGRWFSARGAVLVEPRTNQLFISDVPVYLEKIQAMITKLDVPVRQVLIEARIIEADDQFGKSLGVRLGGGFATPVSLQGRQLTAAAGAVVNPLAAGVMGGNMVNLPAGLAGQTVNVPASMAVSLFNAAADKFLNLEISALESDGKGKIVSSPRVVTADQTKALIEQGTELPYQLATASGATAVSFRKANLKLEVTPQITPEGGIILDVDVNKDSVGQITPAGYAINTKHVKTQVLVENGGTVVIGGIFEQADKDDEARVPWLGELPGLGWLFKNQQRTTRKTEMLVFLTPRVMLETLAR
jgi:type IV pilus assembly protein PilQ